MRTFKTGRIYGICGSSAEGVKRTERAFVEGADYRLIGENADYVFNDLRVGVYVQISDGCRNRFDSDTSSCQYARLVIPAEKWFGIPTYGYDWQLPYERSYKELRRSEMCRQDLAIENGALIQYACRPPKSP